MVGWQGGGVVGGMLGWQGEGGKGGGEVWVRRRICSVSRWWGDGVEGMVGWRGGEKCDFLPK